MNQQLSSYTFKRYIWEDFSQRRQENREKSKKEYEEWKTLPDATDEPPPRYLIGPGEVKSQFGRQHHHGKDEKTLSKRDYSTREPKEISRIERENPKPRLKGLWPDEQPRTDDILHVRSTYVDK